MISQLTLRQRRRNFLNRTKNHYNSTNRSNTKAPFNNCVYFHPIHEGCAIGRELPIELRMKLDAGILKRVTTDTVFNQLPVEMQLLGREFLGHIQCLHDNEGNWNQDGLSSLGKTVVEVIRKQFKL